MKQRLSIIDIPSITVTSEIQLTEIIKIKANLDLEAVMKARCIMVKEDYEDLRAGNSYEIKKRWLFEFITNLGKFTLTTDNPTSYTPDQTYVIEINKDE